MIRIFIVGTGNLGSHLIRRFDAVSQSSESPVKLVGYHDRSSTAMSQISARYYINLNEIPSCDLIILAVNDDAIKTVVNSLPAGLKSTVAHTSGSVSMTVLNMFEKHGVFYLPQSFSKTREPDFGEITLCWEASSDAVREQLWIVGSTLSRKRKHLPSPQRRQLHLAAVYVNNFVNHCYTKGQELLAEKDLEPELIAPLMRETLEKALAMGSLDAQTGPARRCDQTTIQKHLKSLAERDRDMYRAITHSIIDTYEKL